MDTRQLSSRFRAKFLKGLSRLRRRGELKLEDEWSRLLDDNEWERFLKPLRGQGWSVYLEPPPTSNASPENLLKYLAHYVAGGPISNGRLISHENGEVTFWARDKSKTGNRVPVRISGIEFVRRWSLHLLPSGFRRVRYYGGLSPKLRTKYLDRCRSLLGIRSVDTEFDADSTDEPLLGDADLPDPASATSSPRTCPECSGPMRLVAASLRPSRREVFASPMRPRWYTDHW